MDILKKGLKVATALTLATILMSTAASAATIALVTINQQALFFNQINDGAKAATEAAASGQGLVKWIIM